MLRGYPRPEIRMPTVPDFVLRSGSGRPTTSDRANAKPVLEVSQVWEDQLLETRHFAGGPPVTLGSTVGWRWNFLGMDLGWVPGAAARILPWCPPMWSEVESAWRDDFYVPDEHLIDETSHTVFRWSERGWIARIPAGWDAFTDRDGCRTPLARGEGIRSVPIEPGNRLFFEVGTTVFLAQLVPPGRRVVSPPLYGFDWPFASILTCFATLGALFGLAVALAPPRPTNEVRQLPDQFVELMVQQPEMKEPKKVVAARQTEEEAPEAADRDEGRAGKRDSEMARAKGQHLDKKRRDREVVANAGLLGALRDNGDLEGVFGTGVSDAIANGLGGLHGPVGTQLGIGGLGERGNGPGGGGTATSIQIGTFGARCKGDDCGSRLGPRREGHISSNPGEIIAVGSLSSKEIEEVIRRNLKRFRYCYSRELQRHPNLSGKVALKFVIAKDGTVSSAAVKSSSLNNETVHACMVRTMLTLNFPKPRGGGVVFVSYPFVFST